MFVSKPLLFLLIIWGPLGHLFPVIKMSVSRDNIFKMAAMSKIEKFGGALKNPRFTRKFLEIRKIVRGPKTFYTKFYIGKHELPNPLILIHFFPLYFLQQLFLHVQIQDFETPHRIFSPIARNTSLLALYGCIKHPFFGEALSPRFFEIDT